MGNNIRRVGAQPDGAERVDPQVPPRGPSARGRPGESAWRRHLEVGRFPALCGAVAQEDEGWLASDLSELDLLVIQIDGLHVGDHVLMAAIGVDGNGDKHVLAVVEGATENTVVVQALIDNLLARGLDPRLPRQPTGTSHAASLRVTQSATRSSAGPSYGLTGQPATPRTASQKMDQFYAALWTYFAPPLTPCLTQLFSKGSKPGEAGQQGGGYGLTGANSAAG